MSLESVDRVEVVDRYTVKFLLKELNVWLVNMLANRVACGSLPPKWCSNSAT